MVSPEPVAIVGMGVLLPGAANAEQYWQNIVTGADAITDIPSGRSDPGFHGISGGTRPDQTYGRRGGFIPDTVDFDPLAFGIPPADIDGMEPDQLAALATAVAAVEDAGGLDRLGDRAKVGVILGRGGYLSPGLLRFDQRVRTVRQITRTVHELVPSAGPEVLDRLRTALLEPLGEFRAQSAIGLVPNLAASRVANRLDLSGPAYTVDAACASSLVAVDQAIGELVRRRCDVVLAGGVHHCHDDTLWSMFTQVGALSPSQQIRPLSRDADGLLIGEGTAIVMLKRLADAREDGDRVYAVLRGSGTSSDGKGASLLSPSIGGQVLALERAWSAAGLDPTERGSIGLLEAHGTATKAGDAAELATLAEVFGPADRTRSVVGSVKSMIGHTLPTAGIAGLVKVALALHHRILPPTLHCSDPHPLLTRTRFRTIGEAEDWVAGDRPRRAAVNAFGFGGVNAHIVLEEGDPAPQLRTRVQEPERMLRIAAQTAEELRHLLEAPRPSDQDGSGRFRIGIAGTTDTTLAIARRVAAIVSSEGKAWRGAKDIWCTAEPLLSTPDAKTAYLFPGLEGDATPACADVARHFGFSQPRWSTTSLLEHAESVTQVGMLLDKALRRTGITPDALAGHSVGEWTAMQIGGMYESGPAEDLVSRYWPDGFTVPDTEFLVLGCSAAAALRLSAGLNVVISHDNAPQQTIACGTPDAIRRLAEVCRGEGVIARTLPFRSGFHTPFMNPHLAPFEKLVTDLDFRAAGLPVWSATAAGPYPADPSAIRDLYLAHLVRTVRFRELIESMYGQGFRIFVQVGAGQLGSFVSDTLKSAEHLVIAAASGIRSGLRQLRRVATALWVEGARPRFEALEPRRVRLNTSGALLSLPAGTRGLLEPMVELPAEVSDEIVKEFTALVAETRRSAASVVAAYAGNRTIATLDVSLAAMPYLRDHRFFRQRADWPDESDFWPVVPATTLVDIACRRVERAWPGTLAVGVQDATFSRWLVAEPATSVSVSMRRQDDLVHVDVGPYARMTVRLAPTFPVASPPPTMPGPETGPPLTAAEIYTRREMFHGPAYQGLATLHGIGRWHIRGTLVVPSAPGGLLDNVGQLLGCWMLATDTERLLAFPRAIERITWYEPEPAAGAQVECVAKIQAPQPDLLEMTAHLMLGGRALARVDGWQDVRFPCDRAAHRAYAFPDQHLLSTVDEDGRASVQDRWQGVAARDFYAGVYLNRAERSAFAACAPREQRSWLLRRIAIKDAVRVRLGERVYPAEIHVHDDEKSVSGLHGRTLPGLTIRVTHAGDRVHALATQIGSKE